MLLHKRQHMTPNFFTYYWIPLLLAFYHAALMHFFLCTLSLQLNSKCSMFTLYTKKYNPCILLLVVVISSVTVFSVTSREMQMKGKMWNWSSPLTERAAADMYELSRKKGRVWWKPFRGQFQHVAQGLTHTHTQQCHKETSPRPHGNFWGFHSNDSECVCVCVRACACMRVFLCWCSVASLSHHLTALASLQINVARISAVALEQEKEKIPPPKRPKPESNRITKQRRDCNQANTIFSEQNNMTPNKA